MKLKSLIKTKNKQGGMIDLIVWLAISFIAIIFFAAWIYGFNTITETLATMNAPILGNENNSIANISSGVFGEVNRVQTNSLHLVAFVLIFFTALAIPITNFLQKSHPVFFAIYLMIIIAAFMASVYISNQYENLLLNPVLGETLAEFTGSNFIMLNLPIWTAVVGLLGAIFLFAGILKDAGSGGTIV